MKLILWPRDWRIAREGRHLLLSAEATFFDGNLCRYWRKVF
jgi:hypothetical protein